MLADCAKASSLLKNADGSLAVSGDIVPPDDIPKYQYSSSIFCRKLNLNVLSKFKQNLEIINHSCIKTLHFQLI